MTYSPGIAYTRRCAHLVTNSRNDTQVCYPLGISDRDAGRGKDDRLHQALVDGGGLACGDAMVLAAGCSYPVLAGQDNGRDKTKAKGTKAGDVCGRR